MTVDEKNVFEVSLQVIEMSIKKAREELLKKKPDVEYVKDRLDMVDLYKSHLERIYNGLE